jgi:hypothetical protein
MKDRQRYCQKKKNKVTMIYIYLIFHCILLLCILYISVMYIYILEYPLFVYIIKFMYKNHFRIVFYETKFTFPKKYFIKNNSVLHVQYTNNRIKPSYTIKGVFFSKRERNLSIFKFDDELLYIYITL